MLTIDPKAAYKTKAEAEAALAGAGYRPVNWTAAPDVWITRDGRVARLNLVHGPNKAKMSFAGGVMSDEPSIRVNPHHRWEYPVVGHRIEEWSMEESLLAYWIRDVFGDVAAATA